MKLIDGKSVLLGMGIGIIVTAILGFVFFLGYQPQLSDSEIIDRAKHLGMSDNVSRDGDFVRNRDGSLSFTINEGDTSRQVADELYAAGVIDSSIEFELAVQKDNLQDSIKPGKYNISYTDGVNAIIDMITK